MVHVLLKRQMRRSIYGKAFNVRKTARKHLYSVAQSLNMEVVQVLEARSDTRCVALCKHAEFGKVALKTSVPSSSPWLAMSSHAIIHHMGDYEGVLFPEVYAFGIGYSIERWLEGESLSQMSLTGREKAVESFLNHVKAWASSLEKDRFMSASELEETVRWYVEKITNKIDRGHSLTHKLSYLRRVHEIKGEVNAVIDAMVKMSDNIHIRPTFSFCDMSSDNIIFDFITGDLMVIDHEHVTVGHFGFGLAYLVAYMTASGADQSRDMIAASVFESGLFETPELSRYFLDMSKAMTQLFVLIAGIKGEELRQRLIWAERGDRPVSESTDKRAPHYT